MTIANDSIYVGDTGINFIITVNDSVTNLPKNISLVTIKKINVKRAGGSLYTKDMDFVTDGSDGKIKYTVESGDLTVPGKYTFQLYFEGSDGVRRTSSSTFHVESALT